jgi:hypothetical protein
MIVGADKRVMSYRSSRHVPDKVYVEIRSKCELLLTKDHFAFIPILKNYFRGQNPVNAAIWASL